MNEETKKDNDINDELKPVKDKPKKKLSRGALIAISATVAVVVVGLVGPGTTTQGAPRSARLSFEQRKTQIEQQIAQSHNDAESETSESDPAR
jgi:hypothetical protein